VDDYFDPRNSFLNEVLDRRLGIPISLSVLYMEVGRRVGLDLQGVSFPGHFLVKLAVHAGEIVIDPFMGGASLSKDDLEYRLSGIYKNRSRPGPELSEVLTAASSKEILVRMLRNLKGIYVKAGDFERALNMVQHTLQLRPHDARETRDRGYIYQRLECFRAANADFQRYLELAPDADDVEEIRGRYVDTYHAGARLH
jgi:regulator of sirC expression with transglutaminase-like and TPR domain